MRPVRFGLFIVVGGLALSAGAALATPITVLNPGFDTDTANGRGTPITFWPSTDPELASFSSSIIVANSTPNVVDLLNDSDMYQLTSHTIAAGETYTLGFYEGYRTDAKDIETQVVAKLVAATSGDVLGSVTIPVGGAPAGTMALEQLTTTAPIPAGDVGDILKIEFVGGGAAGLNINRFYYQAAIDSVSLSVVPEPASAGLLGLAAVGVLARRRRA